MKQNENGLWSEVVQLVKHNIRDYMMYIALIVIMAFFSFKTNGGFISARNIINLINQSGYVAILAIGMTLILIIKHIDLNQVPGYTCWATMLSQKPYYVLQNDFSAMISSEMYDDFYLPILKKECEAIPRTIYHLDGPGAVRHLDSILTVEELDGVQWINGAGAAGLDQWPDIYKKIIGAGKLCQVFINGAEELRYIDDIVNIVGTTKGLCFICTGDCKEKELFDKYLEKYQ